MTIQSVCVYCGSSNHVDESYKKLAVDVGTALAEDSYRVVYGGGRVGLMGLVADSALKAGGDVIGIIPQHIVDYEVQHEDLTELHVVDNMHVRKNMMAENADAFVALPGGFGTLDETFEILTWKQLSLHNKPVIIYNLNDFWTPLIELIDHLIASGFAPKSNHEIFKVVTSIEELREALKAPINPEFTPNAKWA